MNLLQKSVVILSMFSCLSCSSESNNSSITPVADTGADTTTDASDTSSTYQRCSPNERVGGFELALSDGFSTVQGQVRDGVNPNDIPVIERSESGCDFLTPPQHLCDPVCEGGSTCNAGGECVVIPSNQDVGTVTVTGLTAPVEMDARAPVNIYSFTDDLPHPAFSSVSSVTLGTDNFDLSTSGVDQIESTLTSVELAQGSGVALTWVASDADASDPNVRVEIELNIANHGGTPGRIECRIEDTGTFTIPATLVDALLANGYSGFPSLRMTRHGVSSTETTDGCIELSIQSEIVLPVEIPGLVSCSDPEDCADGQTCRGDLTCG